MKSPKKEIKDVRCKGNLPDTDRQKCNELLYQSDGEFLYVSTPGGGGKLIINSHLDHQVVTCDKCGYRMNWRRKE